MDSHPSATDINLLGRQTAEGKIINTGGIGKVKSRAIDGFVKAPSTASYGLQQRGQKAQTLMRDAVKKPAATAARVQNLRPGFNAKREVRAKQTAKYSKVDRFGGFVSSIKLSDRPRKEPLLRGEVMNRSNQKSSKAPAAAVMPSMVASASHQRLERMLDEALTKADAHKQALKYHAARHFWQKPGFFSKKRWTKLTAVLVVLLGAGLFVAWQKIPQLSLKVASIRTHLDASIPTYKPFGYKMAGPAKVVNHSVTLQYASVVDKSKTYTVREQSSNLDTTSLIANNASQSIQRSEANGIPIVIVANKAMCVSEGQKKTVTDDDSALSPDELLNVAKSVCA